MAIGGSERSYLGDVAAQYGCEVQRGFAVLFDLVARSEVDVCSSAPPGSAIINSTLTRRESVVDVTCLWTVDP
jgi:hypothetical protein